MKPHPVQPSAEPPLCTCRICGQGFQASRFGPPIIGEIAEQKLGRYYQVLGKHLQTAHPQELALLLAPPGEMATMAILSAFDKVDLDLSKAQDQIRWKIHQITRRVNVSDEMISLKLAALFSELFSDPEWRALTTERAVIPRVRALVSEMRDALMEKDAYHDLVQQPEPVAV